MTARGKSQRQIRKQILRHLEDTFDLPRLDYKKRVTPLKHRAKLVGVAVAGVVYGLGFGLAYFAWKTGRTDYETFVKFVWIFMVPSSVVGAFAYMLNGNRREFGVAKDIFDHIDVVEGASGMLWRYEPILTELFPDDKVVKHVLESSREGSFAKLEPEDYAKVVHQLHAALESGEGRSISDTAADAFESNLAKAGGK
jgi:hypothetical protein